MTGNALHWLFTFASPYHAIWFAISMAGLIVAIFAGKYRTDAHVWAVLFHVTVVIEAAIMVWLVRYKGPVYSINCVWFNALMAFIHWRLLRRCVRRQERDPDP